MGILATDFVEFNPKSSTPFCMGKSKDDTFGLFKGAADSSSKSEIMNIAKNGTISFKAKVVLPASTSTTSDRRLKENISKITDAISKVYKLNGVTFNFIGDEERHAGLIAQDVQQVLPEAVIDMGDKLTLDYTSVIGLLVNAINEQTMKITSLESKIAYLESKVH